MSHHNQFNYNSDEEIEEDIQEEPDAPNNNKMLFTYDQFLLQSVVIPNQPKTDCQQILNNQMKEIISNIKQEKTETLKTKENKKRKLLQNISTKYTINSLIENQSNPIELHKQNNEENLCNIEQTRFINMIKDDYTNQNKPITNIQVSNDNLYNINFEEFTRENAKDFLTHEEVYVNRSNNNLFPQIKAENIAKEMQYSENKMIVNQNDTVYQNNTNMSNYQDCSINNQLDPHDFSALSNAKNIIEMTPHITTITNHQKNDKKRTADENYQYFLQKSFKNNNTRQNDKYNKINANSIPENVDNNNNTNHHVDQRLIVVENYTTEQEKRKKEEKMGKLREKKLKELEQKRFKSKGKLQRPSTVTSEQSSKRITSKNSNQPVIIKSTNTNNKVNMNKSKQSINTTNTTNNNISNIINSSHNNNKSKQRPSTAGIKMNTSNQTGNESLLSRIPVKIQREESYLANEKIKKTVKYSKMSNKKMIKKAIGEVCLAGQANRVYREKIIDVIDKCDCENYIILFKGNYGRFDLKGVYTFETSKDQIELLTCLNNAPDFIDSSMIMGYFKYDSSQNKFKELMENKDFSVIVDGITLKNYSKRNEPQQYKDEDID